MTEKVKQQHMFSNKMIAGILIPVVLEQLLNSIMGTADTMMVSNIGSAAISAVSPFLSQTATPRISTISSVTSSSNLTTPEKTARVIC